MGTYENQQVHNMTNIKNSKFSDTPLKYKQIWCLGTSYKYVYFQLSDGKKFPLISNLPSIIEYQSATVALQADFSTSFFQNIILAHVSQLKKKSLNEHVLVFWRLILIVQKSIHVGTLYHLDQDGSQFTLQSQKALANQNKQNIHTKWTTGDPYATFQSVNFHRQLEML